MATERFTTEKNTKGIGWVTAVVFVVGDLVGGGLLGLPVSMVQATFVPGFILLIVYGSITTFTGYLLAEMWIMMQARWPKYRKFCRKPYVAMANQAYGPSLKNLLIVLLILTQFGFACVLLLLGAKNAAILLNFFFSVKISYCYLIFIVGLIVWPATMLRSPMDFWQIAIFSGISSSIAAVLIVVGTIHDASVCSLQATHPNFEWQNFFMAYGTFAFAYVGFIFYISVAVSGYEVYGNSLGEAVIPSIQLSWVRETVNLMIAIHVLTTIIIVLSPMFQLFEDFLKVSHKFGWGRFLLRSVSYWLCVFICLTVPNFGPLMDLIGASTMTITSAVLPNVCYLYLNASGRKREERIRNGEIRADSPDDERANWRDIVHYTKKPILVFCLFCIVFGTAGGVVASVASAMKLASSEVDAPCYVQYFRTGLPFNDLNSGMINCCGSYRNVTVSGISPHGYCNETPK